MNIAASQQNMTNILGIMVISRSLVTVNHAIYDRFEHPGMLRWVSLSLVEVSFTLNAILNVY